MRKVLIVLGSIFGLILITLVGFGIYGGIVGPKLDSESKAWVDQVVPEIVSSWDVDKMVKNISTQLSQVEPRESFENLFAILSAELGPLQEYNGSEGEAGINVHNGVKTVTAKYTTFTKGKAQVVVTGIKENGEWRIQSFYVTPRAN